MIIEKGEKVHIIRRRAFREEEKRHFVGETVASEGAIIRVRGYSWVFDEARGAFVRRDGIREKIIAVGDMVIINIIPREIVLEDVAYRLKDGGLVVTDGKEFTLEINEFSPA